MIRVLFLISFSVLTTTFVYSQAQIINQFMTAEDSLSNPTGGNIGKKTYLGSYGELAYKNNLSMGEAQVSVQRFVLFLGQRFNKKISLFTELELENAAIESNRFVGEISLEQAFLRFSLNRDIYLVGGLFLPRIGLLNENHLPTNYWSVDRPMVEQLIIPTTWREMGIGIYGSSPKINGFQYTAALVNGLDISRLTNGTGLREGRGGGAIANAKNIAFTASVSQNIQNFRIQASGYYGGGIGLNNRTADSLQIQTGALGSPVGLAEINATYSNKGFYGKAIYAQYWIPDAYKINRAFANNTANSAWGAYGELGYNILQPIKRISKEKSAVIYTRVETIKLDSKVPENGIKTGTNTQLYISSGVAFQPIRPVIIKAEYTYRNTESPNPALIVNPFPQQVPYLNTQQFIKISAGYNF